MGGVSWSDAPLGGGDSGARSAGAPASFNSSSATDLDRLGTAASAVDQPTVEGAGEDTTGSVDLSGGSGATVSTPAPGAMGVPSSTVVVLGWSQMSGADSLPDNGSASVSIGAGARDSPKLNNGPVVGCTTAPLPR